MAGLSRSPRFFARLLEDHLVVVDRARLELRVLNPSAAVLWLLLEEGWQDASTLREALSALAPAAGGDLADATEGSLREWCGLGWLESAGGRVRLTRRQAPPLDPLRGRMESHPAEAPLPSHRVVSELRLRLGSRVCNVRFCETGEPGFPEVIPKLRALLSGMAAAGSAAHGCELRFLNAGARCWVAGLQPAVSTAEESLAVSLLITRIFRYFHQGEGPFVYMHGASVAGESGALLLPGRSGAGKSTLAAYLAANGWTYLGDDVVGLGRKRPAGEFRVLAFPTAAKVKAGAWPLLKRHYPHLAALPELNYAGRRARFLALAHPDEASGSSQPLRAVVFPRYGADQAARLLPVNAVTALCELVEAGLKTVEVADAGHIDSLLDLLETVPCYRLSYAQLDDAAGLLRAPLAACISTHTSGLTTASAVC